MKTPFHDVKKDLVKFKILNWINLDKENGAKASIAARNPGCRSRVMNF